MMAWSLSRRVLFRFVCCYFVLYCLPGDGRVHILSTVPGDEWIAKPWTWLAHSVCPWVAIHVFHLSGQRTTYFPTGSGDTTLAWIENLLFVVAALLGTLVWSLLDRKRFEYRTAHAWLRLLLRYTLAFTLLSYGFVKVVPLQFQAPRFSRLVEPYGEFSPMGVLWCFMGSSLAYVVFSGCAEVLGGLLLLFRRTTTLGALVSFGVLANVVALNFCYDVPVKLYSTNLLLMAVTLLVPDLRRLFDFLVLNRATEPADPMAVQIGRRPLRIAARVFAVLLAGWALWSEVDQAYTSYLQVYAHPKHPPAYGLFDVETFRRAGEDRSAAVRKVWFMDQGIGIRNADDRVDNYPVKYDAAKRSITVNNGKGELTWWQPDDSHLQVEGKLDGSPVFARLRRIDSSKILLNSRGFHWINEFPFNR
jgi:hypothetical protein